VGSLPTFFGLTIPPKNVHEVFGLEFIAMLCGLAGSWCEVAVLDDTPNSCLFTVPEVPACQGLFEPMGVRPLMIGNSVGKDNKTENAEKQY